ncbi:MAG: hypothetical protein K5639_01445 [Eubacterium sp.]|nr:hypothetical protein [Eubacterium sp.]
MKKKCLVLFLLFSIALSGCGSQKTPESTSSVSGQAVSEGAATKEKYVHGEDGYFNLDEEVTVRIRAQRHGTCWLFASSVSMETAYELQNGKEIELDPESLVDVIYGKDKKEGVFPNEENGLEIGGCGTFVAMTLSNGFGNLVLDRAIKLPDNDRDTIKEYVKKYGAMYTGVPDGRPGIHGYFDGYSTMNCVTDDPKELDHSVAIVGWDDHFPKEYFNDPASQDGAWIAVNSSMNTGYYYISYDASLDFTGDIPLFLSVSDEYGYVASHDCGTDIENEIKSDGEIVTANVFHKKGTLSAVGTYIIENMDQDITVDIYDSDLKKLLYTQDAHIHDTGYHTIPLDEPIEVKDYAIAIHYKDIAPVEGEGRPLDETLTFKTVSKPGQSFIKIGKKWYDLHDRATLKKLGRKKKTNNCCIKGLYTKE